MMQSRKNNQIEYLKSDVIIKYTYPWATPQISTVESPVCMCGTGTSVSGGNTPPQQSHKSFSKFGVISSFSEGV